MTKLSKTSVLRFGAVLVLAAFGMPAMASAVPTWSGSGTVAVSGSGPLTLTDAALGSWTCTVDVTGTVQGGGTADTLTGLAFTGCSSPDFGVVVATTNATPLTPLATDLECSGTMVIDRITGLLLAFHIPALGASIHYSADGAGTPQNLTSFVSNIAGGVNTTFSGPSSGTFSSDLGSPMTLSGTIPVSGATIVGGC
jgi:hypothetical protein